MIFFFLKFEFSPHSVWNTKAMWSSKCHWEGKQPCQSCGPFPRNCSAPPREKGGLFQGGNGRGSQERRKRGMGKFPPPPPPPVDKMGCWEEFSYCFRRKAEGSITKMVERKRKEAYILLRCREIEWRRKGVCSRMWKVVPQGCKGHLYWDACVYCSYCPGLSRDGHQWSQWREFFLFF